MRFDDSLQTVLAAETESDMGAQSAWRQLVDMIGRGRVSAEPSAIEQLRQLRDAVPATVRAASARALAFAAPPASLVALFAEDRPEIAAPVLRTAVLSGEEWNAILPRLTPAGRSILRHRRDLPDVAVRGLAAWGRTDFVLPDAAIPAATEPASAGVRDAATPPPIEPVVVAEPAGTDAPRSEIADLVARIDAYNRTRKRPPRDIVASAPVPATGFRFEADASGVLTWIEGVTRAPLIGLSLNDMARQGEAQVDGGVAGAYRRRSPFRDARLVVGGASDAGGGWRLSGTPVFDPASGRFLGYRGTARRPRADESAAPWRDRQSSESLRTLVHELRTPTSAIAGFAELIESQLFGPVADPYRHHAAAIRGQASALVQAIEDLDTAARIEGDALELRPSAVDLTPLVARALADLEPLAELRGAIVSMPADDASGTVIADDRALERLVTRLLAALISAAGRGERLTFAVAETGETVTLAVDKPAALDAAEDTIDAEGAPLLGTAFALRLAANLANELGGALVIDGQRLTLRLPAAVDRTMGQASTN